jgi:hypothetical protein
LHHGHEWRAEGWVTSAAPPHDALTEDTTTGSMDARTGLLSGGAVNDVVKPGNKKVTLKIKKAAPKPTEAGNWKESDAKSMYRIVQRG